MTFLDHKRLQALAIAQLNKPYRFGKEVVLTDPDPQEFDCSELIEWLYAQMNIKVPDGSTNQFQASEPVKNVLQIGDVGFFMNQDGSCRHVGMLLDSENVIEARSYDEGLEAKGIKTNRVILRPREKWEGFKDFSGWRRFGVLK